MAKIIGYDFGEVLEGTEDADTILGNGGDDLLVGLKGKDVLRGGSGSDTLKGGEGNDDLDGGKGSDLLIGSKGNDILTGGEGSDVFKFSANFDFDIITDYDKGSDKIDLTEFNTSYDEISFGTDRNGDFVVYTERHVGGEPFKDSITILNSSNYDLDRSDFIF